MFGKDFFPTPESVVMQMIEGYDLHGKNVLEPSAGKGNIVDVLKAHGAEVCACENNVDLLKILKEKCKILATDFLKVTSEEVSHLDFIVMNPPFSADEKHILHAWEIAPAGCTILALCNLETVLHDNYYRERRQLKGLIEANGNYVDLGNCFEEAERKTDVRVALVRLEKPATDYDKEFEGFFMGDDEPEPQGNGIMPYNFVRDLVNRYVAAIKLFDEQLSVGVKMHNLINFFVTRYNTLDEIQCMSVPENTKAEKRSAFKKELQKQAWLFVFDKMNLSKTATKGLREDINKFVETQSHIPFTMRNIYRMLEIVIGTTEQRMDKALLEVFDKLTQHYDENRYNVEGWKTNSHYLINEKFILPYMVEHNYDGKMTTRYSGNRDLVDDMVKALCFLTGNNYDTLTYRDLYSFIHNIEPAWGAWHCWGFFEIKGFKKGTMHFKFGNRDLWARFNQRICKLKGYPLPEAIRTKDTERREAETAKRYHPEPASEETSTALMLF